MATAKIVPYPDNHMPPPEAIAIGARSDKYVTKLEEQPPGLLANVGKQCETPKQVIERVLLPGEVVLADFDCYFPYKMLPMWKIILYCVLTGGAFLLVLLYRSIKRWCYRMKCCTPHTLEYVRGKMAVTSKGRLLCWTLEVKQYRKEQSGCGSCMGCCCKLCCTDLCAPPATYNVDNICRTYLAEHVREISHYYRSSGAMCISFCNSFSCGVKVSLMQFDHHSKFQTSLVTSTPATSYMSTMRMSVGAALDMAANAIEGVLNVSSGNTVFLTSSTTDMMHLDDPALVFEDLATLSARFLNVLPKVDDIVENSGTEDLSKFKASEPAFNGLRVVYDDGTVSIPAKWFPMLPQESVVSVTGQVFTMTKREWLQSIITCGYHYCKHIRQRKFLRSAVVLTTQRIVVVDIYQRAGIIPHTLVGFTYQVTSYFPGKIKSGYYRSLSKHHMEAGVLTEGGALCFSLHNIKKSMPFAKALQLSTVRKPNPAIDMMPTTFDGTLQATEKEHVTLLKNEKVVDVMYGDVENKAFCYPDKFPQRLVCGQCAAVSSDPLCSKQTLNVCFPLCAQICTCMMRPFQRTSNVVITNSTVINVIQEGNQGLCGQGFLRKNVFVVSWAPLENVQGHSIRLHTYGEDTCFRRCCAKCGPCAKCFPISNNEMQLSVNVGSYSFGLQSRKQNHNFLEDDKITELTTKLSNLEAGLHQVAMQR